MSVEDAEKRIAHIMEIKEGDDLPNVSKETLRLYLHYLSKNLSFPFDARYSHATGPWEDTHYDVKVTGILDINECPDLEFYGLFCKGKRGRRKVEIPLAEVEVKQKGKNKQLIEDYHMWFWNYR